MNFQISLQKNEPEDLRHLQIMNAGRAEPRNSWPERHQLVGATRLSRPVRDHLVLARSADEHTRH